MNQTAAYSEYRIFGKYNGTGIIMLSHVALPGHRHYSVLTDAMTQAYPLAAIQLLAIAVSPLEAAIDKTSHHQIEDQPITSSVLQQISSTKPYTEGGTVQDRCAAACRGETAIATGCIQLLSARIMLFVLPTWLSGARLALYSMMINADTKVLVTVTIMIRLRRIYTSGGKARCIDASALRNGQQSTDKQRLLMPLIRCFLILVNVLREFPEAPARLCRQRSLRWVQSRPRFSR
jgi:hypothetical protein